MTNRPDSPEDWFKKHKSAHQINAADKRAVMRFAQKGQTSLQPIAWRQWAVAAAGGLALIALVGIWQLAQISRFAPPPVAYHDLNIEFHGFDKSTSRALSQQLAAKQSMYFEAYHQRNMNTEVRHQKAATVFEAQQDGVIVLLTCSDTMIRLSENLVTELTLSNNLPEKLKKGEPVLIDINQDGYILAVNKKSNGPQCG